MNEPQINPQELLEKILNISKEFAKKGQDFAEQQLDIPERGEEREQMLDGLKKGAIASAVIVGLLGTKGGRSLTGTAIKVGGLAALGTAAYKGYQGWRNNSFDGVVPVHELDGEEADARGLLLIQAMVSAANADGKLDDEEQAMIKREILNMNLAKGLFEVVAEIIDQPLSAQELAKKVDDEGTASEVYLAAKILIDDNSSTAEVQYLADLVAGLGMSQQLVAELDKQLS
jgi:uncharacterized membrane protein YebE (DUF533 family)